MLNQKLNNPDAMVLQAAVGSLKRIIPLEEQASLIPILEEAAGDRDPNLSGAAKHMLRELKAAGVK